MVAAHHQVDRGRQLGGERREERANRVGDGDGVRAGLFLTSV
jgi:hypothetical protein